MKKLVRKLLAHYDKFGVLAAMVWLLGCVGLVVALHVAINWFFLTTTLIPPNLTVFPTMLFLSPVVIYFCPPVWASIFLIAERMWMLVGIHKLKGWEPFHFRKMIGRLVNE